MDVIAPEVALTLDGLFSERVRRSRDAVAYTEYDDVYNDFMTLPRP